MTCRFEDRRTTFCERARDGTKSAGVVTTEGAEDTEIEETPWNRHAGTGRASWQRKDGGSGHPLISSELNEHWRICDPWLARP